MRITTPSETIEPLVAYPPWDATFPAALSEVGDADLLRPVGLHLPTYGTARMLRGELSERRTAVGTVRACARSYEWCAIVEQLPVPLAQEFASIGLRFASSSRLIESDAIKTIENAFQQYICRAPYLAASVAALARVVHVLVAEDDDFDTSHSDPSLPFSVFVSVPESTRSDAIARTAEALIHETMHLQLSLFERIVPLISITRAGERAYSPWRRTERAAAGVLHGLYVFRVIERFWNLVSRTDSDVASASFAASRCTLINEEIAETADFRRCEALTATGREFVELLLKGGTIA